MLIAMVHLQCLLRMEGCTTQFTDEVALSREVVRLMAAQVVLGAAAEAAVLAGEGFAALVLAQMSVKGLPSEVT